MPVLDFADVGSHEARHIAIEAIKREIESTTLANPKFRSEALVYHVTVKGVRLFRTLEVTSAEGSFGVMIDVQSREATVSLLTRNVTGDTVVCIQLMRSTGEGRQCAAEALWAN